MQNRNLTPADTYIIYNKGIITEDKIKILLNLYQPIIGYGAVSLYLTLFYDLNKQKTESTTFTHYHLMTSMQLKIDLIQEARYKLEGIGLLKTYVRDLEIDEYMYVLYSPMSAYEFFNHPILNVVLYNNIGALEYEKLQNYYKITKINTKNYEDITASFENVFKSSVNTSLLFDNGDIINNNIQKLEIKSDLDLDLLISSIPKRLVHEKCFNEEAKELILNLAYIYKIDNLNMQGLVRNSLNERGMIDVKELKNSARNYYQFENNGRLPTLIYNRQPEYLKTPIGNDSKLAKLIYIFENTSPYEFLKKSYGNVEPTDRDKKLIETLMLEQKLSPGVINVLIDYVLKVNNKKLTKSYIETLVGQWKRLKVETVIDAMDVCRKEHNRLKKTMVKNIASKPEKIDNITNLPLWFDKKIEKNEQNLTELNEILKEFE